MNMKTNNDCSDLASDVTLLSNITVQRHTGRRYHTIRGSFHNSACMRKISCCRPEFAFQRVFLKHIRIHLKQLLKIINFPYSHYILTDVKPSTVTTHPRDLSSVEIIEGPVSISNSKNYDIKNIFKNYNKKLQIDVNNLNNHTQNTRRGHIQAVSYSYFQMLYLRSSYCKMQGRLFSLTQASIYFHA